jgi:hypothetical protein
MLACLLRPTTLHMHVGFSGGLGNRSFSFFDIAATRFKSLVPASEDILLY